MEEQPSFKLATDPAIITLLSKLIITKLGENDLNIGLAGDSAVLSLDEYASHDLNIHLYCSRALEFSISVEKENDEGELVEDVFLLADDDLFTIPAGLKELMKTAVSTGKTQVFKAN